jgi:hypothetical protein
VARTPANHPHWKTSLLASIAVIGLAGMLFLQFDRGMPQEQDLVRGQPVPQVPVPIPAQDQGARSLAPAGAPAAVPVPETGGRR